MTSKIPTRPPLILVRHPTKNAKTSKIPLNPAMRFRCRGQKYGAYNSFLNRKHHHLGEGYGPNDETKTYDKLGSDHRKQTLQSHKG